MTINNDDPFGTLKEELKQAAEAVKKGVWIE